MHPPPPGRTRFPARAAFDYGPENAHGFAEAGIEFAHADGLNSETVTGIKDTGNAGYVPEDLADESRYEDLVAAGHDSEQDTTYEIKIPLESLGLTRAGLEDKGLGVMLTTTFGESAINSLPQDPAVLDNATKPYTADTSTSAEKEDVDPSRCPSPGLVTSRGRSSNAGTASSFRSTWYTRETITGQGSSRPYGAPDHLRAAAMSFRTAQDPQQPHPRRWNESNVIRTR